MVRPLHLPQAFVVHGAIDQVERLEIRERSQMTTSHLGILQAQQPETRRERRDGFDPCVLELDRFEIGVAEGELLERTNARQVAQLAAVIDVRLRAGIPHGSGEIQGLQARQPGQSLQIGGVDVGSHEVHQLEMKVGRRQLRQLSNAPFLPLEAYRASHAGSPIRQPAGPAARPATGMTLATERARFQSPESQNEHGRHEPSSSCLISRMSIDDFKRHLRWTSVGDGKRNCGADRTDALERVPQPRIYRIRAMTASTALHVLRDLPPAFWMSRVSASAIAGAEKTPRRPCSPLIGPLGVDRFAPER